MNITPMHTSKSLIIELIESGYGFWDEVPERKKTEVYILMSQEDGEQDEILLQDDSFSFSEALINVLKSDKIGDWIKIREKVFSNLESYYYKSADDLFEKENNIFTEMYWNVKGWV